MTGWGLKLMAQGVDAVATKGLQALPPGIGGWDGGAWDLGSERSRGSYKLGNKGPS